MDEEVSPVKLKPDVKRRKPSITKERCLIYGGSGKLVNPKSQGTATFIRSFQMRGTCEGVDVLELTNAIDFNNQCFNHNVSDSIRWHRLCYSSYCSTRNIGSTICINADESTVGDSISRTIVDLNDILTLTWKKVCLFCEQTKYRGETELRRVEYEQFWKTLQHKCMENNDTHLLLKIGEDFSALPALEARYHHKCHVQYIKSSSYKKVVRTDAYDVAFKTFILYFKPLLDSGRALEMASLTAKYKEELKATKQLSDDEINNYRSSTLKANMEKHFQGSIKFADQRRKNASQIVYSNNIELADIINTAAEYKRALHETDFTLVSDEFKSNDSLRNLFYAAA